MVFLVEEFVIDLEEVPWPGDIKPLALEWDGDWVESVKMLVDRVRDCEFTSVRCLFECREKRLAECVDTGVDVVSLDSVRVGFFEYMGDMVVCIRFNNSIQ